MTLRLPKTELPADLKENMIKQLGVVPENVEVLWHSPRVAQDNLEFGARVGVWDAVDPGLKSFAHMAVASQVGCSWCLDVGYFQAQNEKLDLARASQVPRWREADVFTALERDVMGYAEAMTNTPPTVTDEQYAALLERLGLPAMVELTAFIAYVNLATRANVANGVTSQGFSDACAIPLANRPTTSRVGSTA
ncbi:carboxymuconolactone decarboxylase family protein [Streptomyces sp. NBC_01306]|uniref:carboxymuconolactone decarboxylase family protein n=1 Tax=Streptomyces sp. NBC_01306 TaxID=2903819 RepID=UPI002256F7BD|nr:carboxymuconolactone decarboxylase family protein [Streptomyces sp. NBC_01306]MCX4728307.1 carboxymuconolactone decarboxylase family protein [Streptomyces sp. NBC_01306]